MCILNRYASPLSILTKEESKLQSLRRSDFISEPKSAIPASNVSRMKYSCSAFLFVETTSIPFFLAIEVILANLPKER